MLWDLIEQNTTKSKDKIVSIVDPDARVAHKSLGNVERGYKDHILIDEDSEIILSAVQTPFNVGDEKKLVELIEKTRENFEMKPDEISADKVYGTTANRAYLKDNHIISNIGFYKESSKETKYFTIKDFKISEDLKSATCPAGIETQNYMITKDKKYIVFKFDKNVCSQCPLCDQCISKSQRGKTARGRRLELYARYDAVITDLKRTTTEEFIKAFNKRYKVERRFATMVRNHGLRRCRYVKLPGAKIHITLANMVCNIVRMVNILSHPKFAMSEI